MSTPALKGRGLNRRRKGRKSGLKETLYARLFERIRITMNDRARRCTVLEAIMLHLLQKTATGDAQARRLLLRYQEFVARAVKPRRDIVFVDDEDSSAPTMLHEGGNGGRV